MRCVGLLALLSGCLINTGLRDDRIEDFEGPATGTGTGTGTGTTTAPCTSPTTWYVDADGDGFGDPQSELSTCDPPPPTYIRDNTDCDDADAEISPVGTDGTFEDRNCDGAASGLMADADGLMHGEPNATLGAALAGVGDFNGDGEVDFAAGEVDYFLTGRTWLIPTGGEFRSGIVPATAGSIQGVSGEGMGQALAGPGDVTSDGLDDLLTGVPYAGAGYAILIPGNPAGSLLNSNTRFHGEYSGDSAGYAVSGIGDFDGSGLLDIAIGAPWAGSVGKVYIRLGGNIGIGPHSLVDSDIVLSGPSSSGAGSSLAAAGDVDGDGLADLLIGAPYWQVMGQSPGAAYLLYGNTGLAPGGDLEGLAVRFRGVNPGDQAGQHVAGLGDFDGDGLDDFAVAAPYRAVGGAAYVVKGSWPRPANKALGQAEIAFEATAAVDQLGSSVAGVGDVDGDGNHDVLVGATGYGSVYGGSYGPGAAFLVFGDSGLGGSTAIEDVAAWAIGSGNEELAGFAVAGLGDIDHDGLADFAVGAPLYRPNPNEFTGAVYLFGGF